MKILILGANGMLGHTLFLKFSEITIFEVYGTLRSENSKKFFDSAFHKKLKTEVDANNPISIEKIVTEINPDLIINCIGMIKQKPDSNKIEEMYRINSDLPNFLSNICESNNIRMIHVSTDCVFKGNEGNYNEDSKTDAVDEYGKSKLKGEIINKKHIITLRTSIIGHELNSKYSLLEWFLSQENEVQGFQNAIFSGLTTLELFNIINIYLINRKNLYGLFHVGGFSIDKLSFLKIVSEIYKKEINIVPTQNPKINRSLDSSMFIEKTGYIKPSWYKMISDLYNLHYSKN